MCVWFRTIGPSTQLASRILLRPILTTLNEEVSALYCIVDLGDYLDQADCDVFGFLTDTQFITIICKFLDYILLVKNAAAKSL